MKTLTLLLILILTGCAKPATKASLVTPAKPTIIPPEVSRFVYECGRAKGVIFAVRSLGAEHIAADQFKDMVAIWENGGCAKLDQILYPKEGK